MVKKTNVIFFVGSHRTGSKSLAHFFNSERCDTTSIHQRVTQQWLNIFSNMYLADKLTDSLYRTIVEKLLIDWLKTRNTLNIVETNGFNMGAIPIVLEHYPEMKIVHVVRDPRTFIQSQINFRLNRPFKRKLQLKLPYWELKAYYLGLLDKKEWNSITEAEQLAWQWQIKNSYIAEKYSDNENYYLIKYEELFDLNSNAFSLLLKNIGLECHLQFKNKLYKQRLNTSKNKGFMSWQQWDESLSTSINRICGNLMCHYGYGNERQWQKKI